MKQLDLRDADNEGSGASGGDAQKDAELQRLAEDNQRMFDDNSRLVADNKKMFADCQRCRDACSPPAHLQVWGHSSFCHTC